MIFLKGKNLAIATKTQEIPKARDEPKTYLSDKEELLSRKRIYTCIFLNLRKYDVAYFFCKVRSL